jgi:hypothetical protein
MDPLITSQKILTTIITGNGCVTVIYAGSHKLPSFETIYVYIFTVVQNFRRKTGLGRCVFNWFCEAVCSGEFIPFLTHFTSVAWFYLNGLSNTHNSRYWSVHKPKEPYGVPLCHTELRVLRAISRLHQEYSGSSSFRAQQFQKAVLDKLSTIY